jgi:hypothetical protein
MSLYVARLLSNPIKTHKRASSANAVEPGGCSRFVSLTAEAVAHTRRSGSDGLRPVCRVGFLRIGPDRQGPTIEIGEGGRLLRPRQPRVDRIQQGLAAWALDPPTELRTGRQVAWPKRTAAVRSLRGPAEWPIVEHTPEVHGDNQRVGVDRSSPSPRNRPVDKTNCRVHCSPDLAADREPPYSWTNTNGANDSSLL